MKMKKYKIADDVPSGLAVQIAEMLDWSKMSAKFVKQKLTELRMYAISNGIPLRLQVPPQYKEIIVPADTPSVAIAELNKIDFSRIPSFKISLAKGFIMTKLKNDPTIPTR